LTGGCRPAVRDSRGWLHVVYSKNWLPVESEVYYSFSTDNGVSWSVLENVSRDGGDTVSVNAALAIDSQDVLHCVWFRQGWTGSEMSCDYYYSSKTDSGWTAPVNISRMASGSNVAEEPSISVGSDGRVHVAFELSRQSSCDVFYTRADGDTWLTPVRVSTPPEWNEQPALTVSTDSVLHLCWRIRGADSAYIYYSRYDTAWTPPHPIAACPSWAGWPSLAASFDGTVHLGFDGDDGSGETDVYYMSLRNGEWSNPEDLSNTWNRLSWSSAVAVDRAGTVYFCWSEEDSSYHSELRYRWHATDWSATTVLAADSVLNSWSPRFVEHAGNAGPDLFWVSRDPTGEPSVPYLIYYMKLSPVTSVTESPMPRLAGRMTQPATLSRGVLTLRCLRPGESYRLRLLDVCGRVVCTRSGAVVAPDGSIRWTVGRRGRVVPGGVYTVVAATLRSASFRRVVIVP
jgi:hypothetical protein